MAPVGLQLYSLREVVEESLERALDMTRAAGYDCVEWYGCPQVMQDPAGARAACEARGLVSYSMHVPEAWLRADALPDTLEALRAQVAEESDK